MEEGVILLIGFAGVWESMDVEPVKVGKELEKI